MNTKSTLQTSRQWLSLCRDFAVLGAEAGEVMARRCLVLARCDARAADEFGRMVSEKALAVAELHWRLVSGRIDSAPALAARAALDHVRRKVRANRARLRR